MEKERTVIHLELNGQHYYYGSLASMYEHHSPEEIGISYASLRNYGLTASNPYANKKCIIRKGELVSKEGNRGIRKK